MVNVVTFRTLMSSCDLYREDVADDNDHIGDGHRRCIMVTTRVQCTNFLSRFFKSPETSILEVSLVWHNSSGNNK